MNTKVLVATIGLWPALVAAQNIYQPPELIQRSREAALVNRQNGVGNVRYHGGGHNRYYGRGYNYYGYGNRDFFGNPYGGYGYPIGGYNYYGLSGVYPVQYGSLNDQYMYQLEEQNRLLQQQVLNGQQAAAPAPLPAANGVAKPAQQNVAVNNAALAREKNQQNRAQQAIDAGNKLFLAEMYNPAQERYRQAIKANPADATPHFLLAQALFASKRFPEAAVSLREGLRKNSEWLQAGFDLRALYANEAALETQMAELARAIRVNPTDRSALFLLGYQLYMQGDPAKAKTVLEQTARLETDDSYLKPFFDLFQNAPAAGQPVKRAD